MSASQLPSQTTSDSSIPGDRRFKKRSRKNQSLFHRGMNKSRRYGGLDYVSRAGDNRPGKRFLKVDECCNRWCCLTLPRGDQMSLFNAFYTGQNKESQDSFLSGLMTWKMPKTHKTNINSEKHNLWSYSIKLQVWE